MKTIFYSIILVFTLQISAQEQLNWVTSNELALQESATQNKPVFVFVTDQQNSEALKTINEHIFKSAQFSELKSKMILLKIDISDAQSSKVRLGVHYTKQFTAPGLSLINKYGNNTVEPLVIITPENCAAFLELINENLQ